MRNNAGGHANHTLFWEIMGPDGGGAPSGDLGAAIDSTFGGFDAFKEKVNTTGVNQFGSGWSWLGVERLRASRSTARRTRTARCSRATTPILGIDVWEHAYYLKYNNRRPDYLVGLVGRRQLGRRLRPLRGREGLSGPAARRAPSPAAGAVCSDDGRAQPVLRVVAQLAEHRSPKPGVAGSSPAGPVRVRAPDRHDLLAIRGSLIGSPVGGAAIAESGRGGCAELVDQDHGALHAALDLGRHVRPEQPP